MADSEVTLLLGEQMIIIYLGINIALPLVFSAVLAFAVLVTVQLSRFIKKKMGQSGSKSKVAKLRSPISAEASSDDISEDNNKTKRTGVKMDSLTPGNSMIRKRRPSIHSEVNKSSPQPSLTMSTEGSFTSTEPILLSSSRPSSNSSKSRTRRIGSSNSVSPSTLSNEASTPTLVLDAWTTDPVSEEGGNLWGLRADVDMAGRVLGSPSQCQMEGVSGRKNNARNRPVFADDMNAFDIW